MDPFNNLIIYIEYLSIMGARKGKRDESEGLEGFK